MDSTAPQAPHHTRPEKELTRQRYRSLRKELTDTEQQNAAQGLLHHAQPLLEELYKGTPGTIAAYLSIGSEPGTAPLLELLAEQGYDVVVPVCEKDYRLSWTHWSPEVELVPSPRSWVREPSGPRSAFHELPEVPLILVPGLVLDQDGNRMGQGGGYYDRFLADVYQHPNRPATVGVVHAHEVVEPGTFACDPHDMRLDGVLTPAEFSWFSR